MFTLIEYIHETLQLRTKAVKCEHEVYETKIAKIYINIIIFL